MKESDLPSVLTPRNGHTERRSQVIYTDVRDIPPLTDQEIEESLKALARAAELADELRAAHGPFPDSVDLIHEMREERTEQLIRALES